MNRSGSTDPTDIPRASHSAGPIRPLTGRHFRRHTDLIARGFGCQLASRDLSLSGVVRNGIRHCFDLGILRLELHRNQHRIVRSSLGESPVLR